MYRTLDPDKIVVTIDILQRRIAERFPGAGLANVCGELATVARENRERLERIRRPHLGLRLMSWTVLLGGLAALGYVASIIKLKSGNDDLFGVMQGIEASVNLLIVIGAAVLSLVTLESRWKRKEALADLHELRSIIHVIDMHQLTKDPGANPDVTPPTPSSPPRRLSAADLARYLDYCSEMLSLTSKVAALYAENMRDSAVIEAVSDLDQLTSNLSGKIWQKISIVQRDLVRSEGHVMSSVATAAASPQIPASTARDGGGTTILGQALPPAPGERPT